MTEDIKIIAFDADDTLWINQNYFDEAEARFKQLMKDFIPVESAGEELLKIEVSNMPIYGFGVKAATLSMIEAALQLSGNRVSSETIGQIIGLGKTILDKPVELLNGVEEVLKGLYGRYKLVLVTKGDLLDQERKLRQSGLERFFNHIEIMSDKRVADYQRLMKALDCKPKNVLMIGNSLRSDIIPVLEIGGYAAYVPYESTWAHEAVEDNLSSSRLIRIDSIAEILPFLT